MPNPISIFKIYPESFRANMYSLKPFRMIGLIDVEVMYSYGMEKMTLAYFRSSGTNSGKVEGLWYPIAGIKIRSGKFTEFTPYINLVLTNTTRDSRASRGWLCKSLFFTNLYEDSSIVNGFSSGIHYKSLLWIGETLRDLYEANKFQKMLSLDDKTFNSIVTSKEIYEDNKNTQRENFEKFIEDIFTLA